jgi:hypothetical protein
MCGRFARCASNASIRSLRGFRKISRLLSLLPTFVGKSLNARNISHRFSISIREKVLHTLTQGRALTHNQ